MRSVSHVRVSAGRDSSSTGWSSSARIPGESLRPELADVRRLGRRLLRMAVAIARALAAQPECVLYDEPTTMVDPIMSDDLGNLMLRLKKQLGLTAIVVTHDLELMRKVADSVMFLYKGEAIYFGPVSRLDECQHPHVRQFLAMDRLEMAGKIEDT